MYSTAEPFIKKTFKRPLRPRSKAALRLQAFAADASAPRWVPSVWCRGCERWARGWGLSTEAGTWLRGCSPRSGRGAFLRERLGLGKQEGLPSRPAGTKGRTWPRGARGSGRPPPLCFSWQLPMRRCAAARSSQPLTRPVPGRLFRPRPRGGSRWGHRGGGKTLWVRALDPKTSPAASRPWRSGR